MSGATVAVMAAGFGRKSINIVRTYDNGSGADTIPVGARKVTIEVWGGGGGGGRGGFDDVGAGGASGSYAVRTVALTLADEGKNIQYSVGLGGGGSSTVAAGGTGGTSSSTSGTLTIPTMTCLGGTGATTFDGGTGQAATGGTTNISGVNGGIGQGAGAPAGGGPQSVTGAPGTVPGGGGGPGFSGSAGGDGQRGRVRFSYT